MLLLLVILSMSSDAQQKMRSGYGIAPNISKPCIEVCDLGNWPHVSRLQINSNGKYCGYTVESSSMKYAGLVLKGTTRNWELNAVIAGSFSFSSNGHKAVWINAHDSLCIANLGTSLVHYIPNVLSFHLKGDHLTYQPVDGTVGLITLNLNNVFRVRVLDLKEQAIISDEAWNLSLRKSTDGYQILVSHRNGRGKKSIWEGRFVENIIVDDSRTKIAFVSRNAANDKEFNYYSREMDTVVCLKLPVDSTSVFAGISRFSRDGRCIYINWVESGPVLKDSPLNLWSYLDSKLQSQQMTELSSRRYTGIIRLSDRQFVRLDRNNDWLFLPGLQDTIALIRQQEVSTPVDEVNWNKYAEFSWYTVSLKNGRRISLGDINKSQVIQISPLGRYVIYYDDSLRNYFVYETKNGNKRCLTEGIDENWVKKKDAGSYGRYIAAWGKGDAFVLINGERDIWRIALDGLATPRNLTNGYGRKHNIVFTLSLDEYSPRPVLRNETLLLNAFNLDTKENGFYSIRMNREEEPDSLSMGPYVFDIKDNPCIPPEANFSPVKARKAKRYVVRRMSTTAAPNFFLTTNFRSFKPLSDIQPHLRYNWYRSELHSWTSLNGESLQGILYKPENFDSTKKYPVIFYCYEKKSDGLNLYLEPQFLENGCGINIPHYVSGGYLIFCPDISYQVGDPMQGAYDAIVSAVDYISEFKYVDVKRIGIQGCSWGAIQTNYLITHSGLFAAACSASGIANWVSNYNSIAGSGESMQGIYEVGQFRMGSSLWQNREGYIKSSPLFNAGNITTPSLFMHTRGDMICDFANICEFFLSLHQLKKKSWLLVYDGNHGIYGKDSEDFSLKMRQFFDYYLSNCSAPKWMNGIDFR